MMKQNKEKINSLFLILLPLFILLTFTVTYAQLNENCTVSVLNRTAKITATTGTVGLDTSFGGYYLRFGSTTTPGISFSRTITVPTGFSGTTQWVQLTDPLRRRKLNDGTWQKWTGSGLDTTYPYDTASSTNDSPGTPLTSSYLEKSANDSFEMWLMFKPSTANAIWVPLRKVNWSWSGEASRSGTTWTLDSSSNTVNPSDSDSTTHPTWTSNVTSLTWVNE